MKNYDEVAMDMADKILHDERINGASASYQGKIDYFIFTLKSAYQDGVEDTKKRFGCGQDKESPTK